MWYNRELGDASPARKKKKVTHIKWFEPYSEGENSNKFIAVFEDGTFFIYFKESKHRPDTSKQKIHYKTQPF